MRFIPAVSPVQIQSPLPYSPEMCGISGESPFSKIRPVGQVVKTRPFHGCNMGSSPVRVTTSAIRKRDCRINGGLAQLVRAPASHAGGHWFESSSLHQKSPGISTVSVHKEVFSYERLVVTSVMEAAAFSLSMVDHGLDDPAIASISFMVARSTSPTPVK